MAYGRATYMRRHLAVLLPLFFAACATAPGDLDRHFLSPASEWLAEPAMLGRSAEPFEIETSAGSLTGWFLPCKQSNGRTVVLFQDGHTNTSQTYPWYTFLLDGGFNVCVFDYCGIGKSKGEPSLRAAFYEMPKLLSWLGARADVDKNKVAWYGIDIGSAIALHAAVHTGGCKALVLEDMPSLRDHLRDTVGQGNAVSSTLSVGFAEFVHAPEDSEPMDNAPKVTTPSLWISGADRTANALRSTLGAYVAMGGDKQLWLVPSTSSSPHALMTHDGEYQRAVTTFLRSALDGTPDRISTDYKRVSQAETGGNWFEVALDRRGTDQGPWAVQVAAVDADGKVTMQNTWLEGSHGKLKMRLAQQPGLVTANRVGAAERADTGGFKRTSTPLSRAGEWYDAHVADLDTLRNGDPDLAKVTAMADALHLRQQQEPFPPTFDAQLADVYYQIGRVMTAQPDAEKRAAGLVWLRRAVNAKPQKPELQYWPWRTPTWGFPHDEQVAAAKALLARIEGGEPKK